MKTMKKLQVAAAAASLFMVSGVATAAQLNSSGTQIAAETIQPGANNTRIRAPAWTYSYEGGVSAASSQIFKITTDLVGGAQWAIDTTRVRADFDAITTPTTTQTAGSEVPSSVQAATILAVANVGGVTRKVGVFPANAIVPAGKFAIILRRVEKGNTIGGAPFTASGVDTAITYVFELVNNTADGLNLDKLSLTFSAFKDPNSLAADYHVNTGIGAGQANLDTYTTAVNQYPLIYNLAALTIDTSAATAAGCVAVPQGRIDLRAVSGNNDPATLSQEDTVGNNQAPRIISSYIIPLRNTFVSVAPALDRLIQTTNSFQTNQGTTPVNGIGGTGGGRFSFKPSTTSVANVWGGDGTGTYIVNNATNGPINAFVGTVGTPPNLFVQAGTFPERTTSGDERSAILGTLTFGNIASGKDRLTDNDIFGFKRQVGPVTPGYGPEPSDKLLPAVLQRDFGEFSDPTVPVVATSGNIYGGVDIASTGTAVTLSFATKAAFAFLPTPFRMYLQPVVGPANTAVTTATTACPLTPPVGAIVATAGVNLIELSAGQYEWRISRADFVAALTGAGVLATNQTLANGATPAAAGDTILKGGFRVCYAVTGEDTVPAFSFTPGSVIARVLKDDVTEQNIASCPGDFSKVYGGVKVDVRNFQLHSIPAVIAAGNLGAAEQQYIGLLRLINNSESETATVEGQFIHESGKYGPWGTLATLAPRAATYVMASTVYANLTNPVANATADVDNTKPLVRTTRIRVSADTSTIRVQNYVFNADKGILAEISGGQGSDFVNVDSSNRDHIDQDAQFDIVKDARTLSQRTTIVPKTAIN